MRWTGIAVAAAAATIGLIVTGYWLFSRPPVTPTGTTELKLGDAGQIEPDDWDVFSIS